MISGHTYATFLIAQNENIKFIQSQLGHASITTTIDRYGHILPNTHHGVGLRLDRLLFGEGIGGGYAGTDQGVFVRWVIVIGLTGPWKGRRPRVGRPQGLSDVRFLNVVSWS